MLFTCSVTNGLQRNWTYCNSVCPDIIRFAYMLNSDYSISFYLAMNWMWKKVRYIFLVYLVFNMSKMIAGSTEMPDAMEAIFQSALVLGRSGGVSVLYKFLSFLLISCGWTNVLFWAIDADLLMVLTLRNAGYEFFSKFDFQNHRWPYIIGFCLS